MRHDKQMKASRYFTNTVLVKREYLSMDLCEQVVANPYREETQPDGRIQCMGKSWRAVATCCFA